MYDRKTKIIIILIILTFIFSLFTLYIYSAVIPTVSARSASLYEPSTDTFLYKKNENMRLGMASTTKIMTALIAVEELDLTESIEVDKRAIGVEGSSIYIKEGEIFRAIDLVYALILQSANDASLAIAYKISGSVEAFAEKMNEKARLLGLSDTNFTNPHGLDDKEHYTTAHDLAIITAEALKNDTLKQITSTYKKTIESSQTKRTLVNHNKLLKTYDGCVGVKTGYTKRTGRSLVSACERDGLQLIAVTINAPDDWNDHRNMLDFGYSLLEMRTLAYEGEFSYDIGIVDAEKTKIKVSNKDSLKMVFDKNASKIKKSVHLPQILTAPISEGDAVGEVIFTIDGIEIARIPLYAMEGVEKAKRKRLFSLYI